jgi:hypothetical protein
MDADERLRIDYDQTTQLLRTLTDIRFRLLAFVPTIAAASVGFFGRARPAVELLAIGLLGLTATIGILAYELRNSQIYAVAAKRAVELERQLGFPSGLGEGPGGLITEQPSESLRALGFLPVTRELGLSLVYGAAVAGWSYLVAWGGLHALDVGHARAAGLVIGALVGLLVVVEVRRLH